MLWKFISTNTISTLYSFCCFRSNGWVNSKYSIFMCLMRTDDSSFSSSYWQWKAINIIQVKTRHRKVFSLYLILDISLLDSITLLQPGNNKNKLFYCSSWCSNILPQILSTYLKLGCGILSQHQYPFYCFESNASFSWSFYWLETTKQWNNFKN